MVIICFCALEAKVIPISLGDDSKKLVDILSSLFILLCLLRHGLFVFARPKVSCPSCSTQELWYLALVHHRQLGTSFKEFVEFSFAGS
jgi:hypothetical protein